MAIKQVLKECGVFSVLDEVELEEVVGLVLKKEFEAGTLIFQGGDAAEEFYVLEEGKIALQMTLPTGSAQTTRKVTIDIVGKNEVLGWSAVVEPRVYTFAAVCLQRTKVLAISGKKLGTLFQENPRIGYEVLKGLIKVVASRLDETRRLLVSERLVVTETM